MIRKEFLSSTALDTVTGICKHMQRLVNRRSASPSLELWVKCGRRALMNPDSNSVEIYATERGITIEEATVEISNFNIVYGR